jgi:hypothetical protein
MVYTMTYPHDAANRRQSKKQAQDAADAHGALTQRHLHKFFACQATFFRSKSKADAFTVDCFQFGASCGSRLFPKTIRHAR